MPPPGPSAPPANTALPRAEKRSIRIAAAPYPRDAGILDQVQYLLAIGGPIGFIPWVPATWASLVTALIWWWHPLAPAGVALFTAGALLLGGVCCGAAERLEGVGDPRNVVWDEITGQTLTFLLVAPRNGLLALVGFALFRIFDIFKPFPARRLEHLPGGWGVMLDDVASGLWAAAALWLLHAALPHGF
jgi:phosphatidylglycerophosphatase A